MHRFPNSPIDTAFFATPADFRRWLKQHHRKETELWVGFYKKGSGKPSITWPESVDEALCFGWIDGIRKSLGDESYVIRFTPRKKVSIWSTVNTRRIQTLIGEGRVQPAGLKAYEARNPERSGMYSFEREAAALEAAELKRFKANKAAWKFWGAQPPGYRKTATHWVVSAKKPETRANRLGTLIEDSANGLRIAQLRRA
jgi:uncharacterized protein YdeI (YjbR/CyaY-like superfamily)